MESNGITFSCLLSFENVWDVRVHVAKNFSTFHLHSMNPHFLVEKFPKMESSPSRLIIIEISTLLNYFSLFSFARLGKVQQLKRFRNSEASHSLSAQASLWINSRRLESLRLSIQLRKILHHQNSQANVATTALLIFFYISPGNVVAGTEINRASRWIPTFVLTSNVLTRPFAVLLFAFRSSLGSTISHEIIYGNINRIWQLGIMNFSTGSECTAMFLLFNTFQTLMFMRFCGEMRSAKKETMNSCFRRET